MKRLIVWLAVLMVAVSVFIQLTVMTIMDGLISDFAEKNHSLVGDCVVSSSSLTGFPYYTEFIELIESDKDIVAASPVIRAGALLSRNDGDWTRAVEIVGIQPQTYCSVTGFCSTLYLTPPDTDIFRHNYGPLPGCIRGIAMMNARDQHGKYNHSIDYPIKLDVSGFPLTWKGTLANESTGLASTQSFYVTNDSDTGVPMVDDYTLYIPFEQAQKLCGMDTGIARISEVLIRFAPGVNISLGTERVKKYFDQIVAAHADSPFASLFKQVKVEDWKVHLADRIAPMEKERTMLTALFMLLGLLTVFVVFVVFYIIVNTRHKDIGILRSFGVSKLSLMAMYLSFAAAVGICGSLLGWLAGWAFLKYINDIENWLYTNYGWQLWDRSIYAIGLIPSHLRPDVLFWIISGAVLASILGCLGPAYQAIKQDPVKVLRVGTV